MKKAEHKRSRVRQRDYETGPEKLLAHTHRGGQRNPQMIKFRPGFSNDERVETQQLPLILRDINRIAANKLW